MNHPSIIRPESLAAKIAAMLRFECPAFREAVKNQPRLLELAWFIQSRTLAPGGLPKYIEELVALFAERLGTPAMHRVGKTDKHYTAAERREVIESVPLLSYGDSAWLNREPYKPTQGEIPSLKKFSSEIFDGDENAVLKKPAKEFSANLNFTYFADCCRQAALADLPGRLHDFCTVPSACIPDVWYFKDLAGSLLDMMDAHAARVMQDLAMTEVAIPTIKALRFALDEKATVKIIGDSRFGKTETVKKFCEAYPGQSRLVRTPCSNADRDLLAAIAEAVGIEVTVRTSPRQLRSNVELVIRASGLLFVFDEAAWLFPQRVSQNTPPMRLNWVRSNLMDRDCPVALVTTPQTFSTAEKKYVHTTQFNIDQFNGRIARIVNLPESLSEKDMLAVVRIQFPELPEPYMRRVVGAALVSLAYLSAVEKIAKNARAVAKDSGHSRIELSDLEEGIALAGIVIPSVNAPAPARSKTIAGSPARQNQPIAIKRGRPSAMPALQAPLRQSSPAPALEMPARGNTLAVETV